MKNMKKMVKLSFHVFYGGARRKHGGTINLYQFSVFVMYNFLLKK